VKRRLILPAFIVGLLVGLPSGYPLAQEPTWLVTEGEALLPPAPTARAAPELPQRGPIIRVQSPPLDGEVASPFPVEIVFEPRSGGAPVAIESLKVTYLKLFEVDITERFRPYITENRIFVKNAKIPLGRHRLRIAIADAEGNMTVQIIQVAVR
jgi:hypothetical protein